MGRKIKAEAGMAPPSSRPRKRHRAPLLWLVLPFLGGLIVSSWFPGAGSGPWPVVISQGALTLALTAIFAGTLRGRRAGRAWGVAICATMGMVGFAMGVKTAPPRLFSGREAAEAAPAAPPTGLSSALHRVDVLVLKISAPRSLGHPSGSPGRRWVTCSGLGKIVRIDAPGAGPPAQLGALVGHRVYFSIVMPAEGDAPQRTAIIRLSGTLRSVPARGGADSFNGYLRGLGVAAELSPAWLHAELKPPSWFSERCETLADRMSAILGLGFERRPDLAAIYRAMMLGRKTDLTPAQKELFVASGTMHLFAINGLHIGIVALTVHALLALLRCPRPIGSALVLGVLWLDVQSTGASPSALRAFLMTSAVEAAHVLWLPINPLAAITLAAAIMLALDPRDAFGASFQMSFGVVTALALLGVPLSDWLQQRYPAYPSVTANALNLMQRVRRAVQIHLLGAAGFGAAAAAVSAVTGVEYFGRFAPSGLFANLALMPLATLVIIAGFASIVCGLAHATVLSVLFNAASRLLLQTIAAALTEIVQWPVASVSLHYRADWVGPAALCALLATCFWGYAHDWAKPAGGWQPPFVVAGFALLLGAQPG
jgi:competence protein ComEC